jgi:L-seryl-tRNA(Ser) seleniumtransferase
VKLSELPKVDRLVGADALSGVRRRLGKKAVTELAREEIATLRRELQVGGAGVGFDELTARVRRRAEARLGAGLAPVINATGVILHTNLGRAPLPAESLRRIAETAGRYSTLELDSETGVRTRRGVTVELELSELTGAEDVVLVNNNAAAVLLALGTLAAGREVVVSRGELVEIGGGFRIPEVLARSGARLVEVGTTNRTRVEDYARAIGERTACLLRVHPSNFKLTGFAERPPLTALAALAHEHAIPLVKDLGGGRLVELPASVLPADQAREPTVQACLEAGSDLVCFSLDKLFGGPQGGAVAGRAALVQRLREDALARALRLDKLALAALEGVIDAYRRGALSGIPVHALLGASVEDLSSRIDQWISALPEHSARLARVPSEAAIGGGTLAEAPVASVSLRVETASPDGLARRLRAGSPPVIARVVEGALLLDARSVFPSEDAELLRTLSAALGD